MGQVSGTEPRLGGETSNLQELSQRPQFSKRQHSGRVLSATSCSVTGTSGRRLGSCCPGPGLDKAQGSPGSASDDPSGHELRPQSPLRSQLHKPLALHLIDMSVAHMTNTIIHSTSFSGYGGHCRCQVIPGLGQDRTAKPTIAEY
jgi:hypothetical protein